MSRSRSLAAGAAVAAAAVVALPAVAAGAPPPATSPAVAQADAAQASLVTNEDARIINVRSLEALARAQRSSLINAPFRLRTGNSYTLVLTARSAPYTVNDLLQLAPQTFVAQPDGGYLLSEDLYVEQGATLRLATTTSPLRLRLQSGSSGFVSIVSFGGALDFEGTATAPVDITSYDPATGGPDTVVADGRAYVRSVGGSAELDFVHASDLGFWSGRTGGVALTGNDRPHVGLLGSASAAAATKTYGSSHHLGHFALKKGSATPALTTTPTTAAPATTPPGNGAIQPAGRLNPGQQGTSTTSPFQYVGGAVRNSSFDGDAFGLFVSGAKNFVVTDSSFTHSIYAGLVVHRYVTGALVQRDTASDNGTDGFDVTRAANGVQMVNDTADGNGAVGYNINGNPLATAESAAGMALTAYGNHSIEDSTASHNGAVGIQVNGAHDVIVQADVVNHSPMGIVVRGNARTVNVEFNHLDHLGKQGISIRDGVTGATVESNTIDGAGTGIYVRNSVATVSHNSVDATGEHAISMVGKVGASAVTYNAVRGRGNAAIDTFRINGSPIAKYGNDTSGWVDLRTWTRHLKQLLSPLTILWLSVLVLIAVTAVRGRKRRLVSEHPYANSMSLSTLADGALRVTTPIAGTETSATASSIDLRDNQPATAEKQPPAEEQSGPVLDEDAVPAEAGA